MPWAGRLATSTALGSLCNRNEDDKTAFSSAVAGAYHAGPGVGREESPSAGYVDVQGIRENQLVGYGLVVGLDGTGDKNQVKFTGQSVVNMLKQFGVQIDGSMDPKLKKRCRRGRGCQCGGAGKPGADSGCDRLLHRGCQEPQGRHSVDDASAGGRR